MTKDTGPSGQQQTTNIAPTIEDTRDELWVAIEYLRDELSGIQAVVESDDLSEAADKALWLEEDDITAIKDAAGALHCALALAGDEAA
jgi:hypothetical protein